MSELRVFLLKDCLINPVPRAPVAKAALTAAPLLGLFVPKMIEMAIGGVATLLKKAGDDETVTATGHDFADLYIADTDQALQINPDIGCILAIWGVFDDKDGRPTHPDDVALQTLERERFVPRNADISAIFEAAIRPTEDETAFYLETRHFSVRDFVGDRGKKDRSYVATLSVTAPSATADGETIALGTISLGRLSKRETVVPGAPPARGPQYLSNLMPWKQITERSKAAYDADVAAGQAAGKRYMPVAFNLTISETADGNKFLAKLGELLDGAKEKAAAEISKMILPEERAKAAAERAEAAEKLYADELDAEIKVREAQKAYDAGKPDAVLAAKLEQAKRVLARKMQLRAAAGLKPRGDVPKS
jgi:hypothetical protein